MDLELLIAILAWTVLIIVINLITAIERYKKWLKKGELIFHFPKWEGTKKTLIWYVVWTFLDGLSIPIFLGVSFYAYNIEALLACGLIVAGYIVVSRIIYGVLSLMIRNSHNRTN